MTIIPPECSDSIASNQFIPLILQTTRISSHSNALIDNTFSDIIDQDIILTVLFNQNK